MSESTSDQDRIEHDLERTRSRMDSRLSELQERLSPGQIVDDLMGYFRGSEGGDFARNLMDSVRSNPLPAALTGIGLTWLMASNPHPKAPPVKNKPNAGSPRWTSHEELDLHMQSIERSVVRHADEAEHAHLARLDEARGKAVGVARETHDTEESFGQRIKDALEGAKQTLTDGAQGLRDQAGDAASKIGGYTQTVGDQLAWGSQAAGKTGGGLLSMITANPVLLGAVSLGVGALLGALVPQSDQEEAALGGIAEEARTAARTLAQDAVDRGGQAAQQAIETGRESARAQGLTGDKTIGNLVDEATTGNLVGTVKQVAQDVLKAGDEGLHQQAPGLSDRSVNTSPPKPAAKTPSARGEG